MVNSGSITGRPRGEPLTVAGFTLVELLITMSIMGILLSFALPGFRNYKLSQEVKSAAVDLHISLLYARSEAIKRNADVDIVPVGDWNAGWSVQYAGQDLKVMDARSTLSISGPDGNVTYGRDGRISGSAVDFLVSMDGNNLVTMRCISVSPSGLPSVTVDGDGDAADGECD